MEDRGCNSPWGMLSSNEAGIAFSFYVYKGVVGVPMDSARLYVN